MIGGGRDYVMAWVIVRRKVNIGTRSQNSPQARTERLHIAEAGVACGPAVLGSMHEEA